MIKLQITKTETNEQFEKEMSEYRENHKYGFTGQEQNKPMREITKNVLEVWITDEQFEKIRKSVLETF